MKTENKYVVGIMCALSVFLFTFATCGKCDAGTVSRYTMKNPEDSGKEGPNPSGGWSNPQLNLGDVV